MGREAHFCEEIYDARQCHSQCHSKAFEYSGVHGRSRFTRPTRDDYQSGHGRTVGHESPTVEFVAIDDRALLDKLGDVLPYAKMLHKAGAAIAVCGNVEKDCPAPYNSIWIHDCSAATENILLAVEALGLGAVWTAVEPSDALVAVVKDALKLPDNVVPLCVIPIGHPAVEAKPKDKFKPEKIHWNAY